MILDTSALAAIFFGGTRSRPLHAAYPRRRPLPDERRKLC